MFTELKTSKGGCHEGLLGACIYIYFRHRGIHITTNNKKTEQKIQSFPQYSMSSIQTYSPMVPKSRIKSELRTGLNRTAIKSFSDSDALHINLAGYVTQSR